MDRIDNGNGSFVMGMFRYSSFVGITNPIAKPARTNGTPLGKRYSFLLRPENVLIGSCMRHRSNQPKGNHGSSKRGFVRGQTAL